MMVLHGVCTAGLVERSGERIIEKTGEVKKWSIETLEVFDGTEDVECQLSDSFGEPPLVGEVVTATFEVSGMFRGDASLRLIRRCDASVVTAFTPDIAAMVLAMRGQSVESKPSRAA